MQKSGRRPGARVFRCGWATVCPPDHLARFVVESEAPLDLSALYAHYGSRAGESRIMKSSTYAGFEQDYNAQIALEQKSLLIVGDALSHHPNDSQAAEPTLSAIPAATGTPAAAALDAGYFGPATLDACAKRGIEPYIATGRDPHHPRGPQRFAPLPDPPPEDASPQVKMAHQLKTALGKAIYGARKGTVEPVIGIIKEVLCTLSKRFARLTQS